MNVIKKIVSSILISSALLVIPGSAHAQLAFGGYTTASVPCTCTGGALWWSLMTPLFLQGSGMVPMAGYMTVPIAVTYANFKTHPAQWLLGFYTPNPAACMMIVPGPAPCVPFPSIGLVTPFTGTSL